MHFIYLFEKIKSSNKKILLPILFMGIGELIVKDDFVKRDATEKPDCFDSVPRSHYEHSIRWGDNCSGDFCLDFYCRLYYCYLN